MSSGNGSVRANSDRITLSATGQPRAEISADGELRIDGAPVETTARQRELLHVYKREMDGMTQDGLAIGKQGAALAGKAVSAAIQGALRGEGDQVGEKIKADAQLIEQEARKLCQRLVTIKAAQDQLAAELSAFAPYANIDIDDISDCMVGSDSSGQPSPDASDEAASAASEARGA